MFDGLRHWLYKKYVHGDTPDKLLASLVMRLVPYIVIISLILILEFTVLTLIRVIGRWLR